LLGRFDNDEPVMASLYPAFQEYLDYYNGKTLFQLSAG